MLSGYLSIISVSEVEFIDLLVKLQVVNRKKAVAFLHETALDQIGYSTPLDRYYLDLMDGYSDLSD